MNGVLLRVLKHVLPSNSSKVKKTLPYSVLHLLFIPPSVVEGEIVPHYPNSPKCDTVK